MEKVKISKDGASIDFVQSDKVPVSPKKFRSGAELEGFYRFIFENDLRKEALQVVDRIFLARKAMKLKKPLESLRKAKDAAIAKMASAATQVKQAATATPAKKVAAPKAAKTTAPKAAKVAAVKASAKTGAKKKAPAAKGKATAKKPAAKKKK